MYRYQDMGQMNVWMNQKWDDALYAIFNGISSNGYEMWHGNDKSDHEIFDDVSCGPTQLT